MNSASKNQDSFKLFEKPYNRNMLIELQFSYRIIWIVLPCELTFGKTHSASETFVTFPKKLYP